MNKQPPYLQPDDVIRIVAPAKAIEERYVEYARDYFCSKGYRVKIGSFCLGRFHYFSGTDQERSNDFQEAINDPDVRAIVCARGGYGSIRIIDTIQWASQLRMPKWIVGYSDITVFHQQIQKLGQASIHATMPLNFSENTSESLQTLLYALNGTPYSIQCKAHSANTIGNVQGEIVGGNLSVVCSLIGTNSQPQYKGRILFVEDVGEELYAIDRMFFSLKKAGILDVISGLIIGGMTNCNDTVHKTIGLTLQDIVLQHFTYQKIPICFSFPAGHIHDNRAMVFGETVRLNVTQQNVSLTFYRK